jgi:DnaJ-class molecular chaperone
MPRCPKCAGTRIDPDTPDHLELQPCPACGGTGEVAEEQMGLEA